MTPGDVPLNFLAGRTHLTSVVFIRPRFLRWADEPFDARLVDGRRLELWLVGNGWRLPVAP